MRNLKAILFTGIAMVTTLFATTTVLADSSLSDLTITANTSEGGTATVYLLEDFSSDVTTYNAVAPLNTTSLNIEATTTDEYGTYSTDWTDMDEGSNTSYVYVSGSDGTSTTYTIYTSVSDEDYNAHVSSLNVEEDNDLEAIIDGQTYYVSKSISGVTIPENYEVSEAVYNDVTVQAAVDTTRNITLLYLTSEEGESAFYIYNEDKDEFTLFREIKIKSRLYTVVTPDEVDEALSDYDTETIDINDQQVKVWVRDENEGYYLLYAMNWNGDVNLYQYDENEKCFQRYVINASDRAALEEADKTVSELESNYNALVKKYNKNNSIKWKMIIAILAVVVALIFVILNLILKIKSVTAIEEEDKKSGNDASKNREYYVEKPGKKTTVVPNQKIPKEPEDVDMRSVDPEFDSFSIDLTDDVKREFEEKSEAKAEPVVKKVAKVSKPESEDNEPSYVPLPEAKAADDEEDDDDGFEFIEIDD